jgi:uncharacterized protein (UPF0147 family)
MVQSESINPQRNKGALMRCVKAVVALLQVCILTACLNAQEPVFSGPQPGEKLAEFEVRGVLKDRANQSLNFVKDAGDKPIVLIFVHEISRPTIGFARTLSAYTMTRQRDGLHTGVIWLDDDATTAENTVKRVQHALTPEAPLGVSLDGREGPGSYGLNRDVALTVLIGKNGKVTANFALVQPSIQADMPKVLTAIAEVVGGPVPKLDELPGMTESMARSESPSNAANEQLRPYLQPIIQKDASPENVRKAIDRIEAFVAQNPAAKAELIRIAKTIVTNGKVSNYGTKPAQEFLEKLSKE